MTFIQSIGAHSASNHVGRLNFAAASNNKSLAGNLEFDTANMTPKAIGEKHGVDTSKLFKQYAKQVGSVVQNLWANIDNPKTSLGWLGLDKQPEVVKSINAFSQKVKGKYDDLVIVGIGGSAVGTRAMFDALLPANWNQLSKEQRNGFPRYHIIDNIDPDHLNEVLATINFKKALVNIVSKSGSTAEPMANFMIIREKLAQAIGAKNVSQHIVYTTDPKSSVLKTLAKEENSPAFPIPPTAGGRYSIFSSVGLLPAALVGIPIEELLRGVGTINKSLKQSDIFKNPAAQAAVIEHNGFKNGKNISVFMPYSSKLASTSDWYVQLWAESLGKAEDLNGKIINTGQTPIKAVGAVDQHAQMQLYNAGPFDKIINFVRIKAFQNKLPIPKLFSNKPEFNYLGGHSLDKLIQSEFDGSRASANAHNRGNTTLVLPKLDAYHYGQMLQFLMFKTAVMAGFLNINGFDQPNVELGKQFTYGIMGRPGYDKQLAQFKKHSN